MATQQDRAAADKRKQAQRPREDRAKDKDAPLCYRTADGGTAVFRPDRDRVIVHATGRDARALIEQWLSAAQITAAPWLPGTHPDEHGVLARLPRGPRRARAQAALVEIVERRAPAAELTGRLAAPMHIAGRIDGLTGRLIVRFAGHVGAAEVAALAEEQRLVVIEAVPYAGNCHVLGAAPLPCYEHLVAALAELVANPAVAFAEPDVLRITISDAYPSDYLFPEQRDLQRIGCPAAWALPSGAGSRAVTVAVVDSHGVNASHTDLATFADGATKLVARYAFGGTLPAVTDPHGTQCASAAVGAANNGRGTAGVAGNCRLIDARLPQSTANLDKNCADTLVWAAGFAPATGRRDPSRPGADVLSNSWGADLFGVALPAVLDEAINFVTTFGRDGRGCVMCVAAGNLNNVDFTLHRKMAAHARTIAVGASVAPTSATGAEARASYSPFGPRLDLLAPSSGTVGTPLVDPMMAATLAGGGPCLGRRTARTTLAAEFTLPAPPVPGAMSPTTSMIKVTKPTGFKVSNGVVLGAPGVLGREYAVIVAITGDQLQVYPALRLAHSRRSAISTGPLLNHDASAGGTSHATALVAGAAALVLSARPALNWREVRAILRASATLIGGATGFTTTHGFGRLNVAKAVAQAATFSTGNLVIRDNLSDVGGGGASPGWQASSPDLWV